MADSKVTNMPAATSVNTADVLYLVQSNTDKKLSISTLLGNLPNAVTKLGGTLVLGGTPQTLTNAGAITTNQTITVLINTGQLSNLSINNGTYEGQLKIILATSMAGVSTLMTKISISSISFSQYGHSILLMWYDNKWWPLGGTAPQSV